jgi:integrase
MMQRRSTGGVVLDERRKSPVFALRFRAYGRRQFVTLGSVDEGWTRKKAEDELQNVLADVRRGIWRPPDRQPAPAPVLPSDPTFHEFASQWFAANEEGWRPKTRLAYRWELTDHLLPFFADHRLSQITLREVDRYRSHKQREAKARAAAVAAWQARVDEEADAARRREMRRDRPPAALSATSINKTISRLAQILEFAVEYELIDKNPAKGKRRRIKVTRPAPVWLDHAGQIQALLDAAAELDRQARHDRQHVHREAILATLVFSGMRIGELLALRWRDVDLSAGTLSVMAEAKTHAGLRRIDVLPALRAQFDRLPRRGPDDLVFATSTGAPHSPSNIRRRVLEPAVQIANERREQAAEAPLPQHLTPHKLRHTFASLLVALGVDPGSVMDQLGHSTPGFTLSVYRHGMHRDEAAKQALRELVGLADRAAAGSNVVSVQFPAVAGGAPAVRKVPQ